MNKLAHAAGQAAAFGLLIVAAFQVCRLSLFSLLLGSLLPLTAQW
jgi:hypothetical protein